MIFPQDAIATWSQRFQCLLLALITIFLPLQIFVIIAAQIWQHQTGFSWDIPLLLAVHKISYQMVHNLQFDSHLDLIAIILAKIGSPKTLVPAAILIALKLTLNQKWRLASYLLITAIGSATLNFAIKIFFHRPRPHLWESTYNLHHHYQHSFSFPSGHAMASMTFVILMIIMTSNNFWRITRLILAILFVPTIAWTRLYLGVHYPSDIIAGWLLAIAWCASVYLIIKPNKLDTNI